MAVGTIVKRIGKIIYLVKGPKLVPKCTWIKQKVNEENDSPLDIEHVEILFVTFAVAIPQKAPETKHKEEKNGYRENGH